MVERLQFVQKKLENTNNPFSNINTMLGYIDPGLGGLIVQGLIAGCLTVVYFFRDTVVKIFTPVKRLFKK